MYYIKITECFYSRKVLVYAITEMNLADILIKMTKGNHIKIMYDSMYVQNTRNHSYNLCWKKMEEGLILGGGYWL